MLTPAVFALLCIAILPNYASAFLNMDVQWVVQGYSFGFQGFFIEFLGIADVISQELPLLRLRQ